MRGRVENRRSPNALGASIPQRALWVIAFLAALATSCVSRSTEVLVIVDTDDPTRVVAIEATTSRGAMRSAQPDIRTWTRTGAADDFGLPASFAIVPGSAPRDQVVTLQVRMRFASSSAGQPEITAERTARFRFVQNVPSYVRIFIPASCSRVVSAPTTCADNSTPCTISRYCEERGQTCGEDGMCSTVEVTPTPLPDGGVPSRDASAPDVQMDVRTDVPMDVRPDVAMDVATDVPQDVPIDSSDGAIDVAIDVPPDVPVDACVPGVACTSTEVCQNGTIDCASGSPVCQASGPVASGTACPGGTCNALGECVIDLGTAQDSMVTVPQGVTTMRIRAWGAGGGQSAGGVICGGGYGGYVETIVPVTGGESLRVIVGGAGPNAVGSVGGLGGTPGGGGRSRTGSGQAGGGGGGFSGVFRGTIPLAIAGGGGGGGGTTAASRCPGGGGGGLRGLSAPFSTGGGGGTQSAGGAASGNGGSTPGTSLQGGNGGVLNDSGGGGGGGYFGGGGGQGASSDADSGGGGSGFVSGTAVMFTGATPTAPGNALDPLRGGAGGRSSPGRVVLSVPGM